MLIVQKETGSNSYLHAALGTVGIPSFFHKKCWNIMGAAKTEVMTDIHHCSALSTSGRISSWSFDQHWTKTGKVEDFKVGSGLEAR